VNSEDLFLLVTTASESKRKLQPMTYFQPWKILRARNPKQQFPGAGRRVKVEIQGDRELLPDATTGDIQLNQDSRARPARLRRRNETSGISIAPKFAIEHD
jgi:hypothetical protein